MTWQSELLKKRTAKQSELNGHSVISYKKNGWNARIEIKKGHYLAAIGWTSRNEALLELSKMIEGVK
jgi:hypothetical protein